MDPFKVLLWETKVIEDKPVLFHPLYEVKRVFSKVLLGIRFYLNVDNF